jgi:hypothetical protein
MVARSVVELPHGAEPPLGDQLLLEEQLPPLHAVVLSFHLRNAVDEDPVGRLGFWRWTLMFFGIAGTYRRHHSVDVQYRLDRREQVATGLEIRSLEKPGGVDGSGAKTPEAG